MTDNYDIDRELSISKLKLCGDFESRHCRMKIYQLRHPMEISSKMDRWWGCWKRIWETTATPRWSME